jgi:hypothetical protein
MWDAIVHFVGQSNIAISTAASSEFRQVIQTAFVGGFDRARKNPKGDVEQEFKAFCPLRKPTALRKYVVQAASAERDELEALLKENRFAAMTMDGGQVGALGLFITNLVAAHLHCCFTASIAKRETTHNHSSLRTFLASEIGDLAQKNIIVSVITCDGASYQTKVLNYQDQDSLQLRNVDDPIFSRVLYMPCLCHRLNNAYRRLASVSLVFGQFIVSLQAMAVFCHKPAHRRQLGRNCPAFIETRWLYDCRILEFVLKNQDGINSLADPIHQVEPIFLALSGLLTLWSSLVTRLEGSSCGLSNAYPEIQKTTNDLAAIRDDQADETIAEVYQRAIELINQYTIDSTYDIIQLAYILTPPGRHAAFEQMHQCLMSEPPEQGDFDLEIANFDGQLADHEEEPINELESQTNREEEDVESEIEGENESFIDTDPHEIDETDVVLLHFPSSEFPSTYLAHRARVGLNRILHQFRLDDEQTAKIREAFQTYISSPESQLGVRRFLDTERYCWLSAQTERPQYAFLAEIALRLEPAICSEAPSERAIGQQRRFLIPHRRRTNTDLLLARTTMEDRRNQAQRNAKHRNA